MALLATGTQERLSAAVRDAVLEGAGCVSIISYWEVMMKSMKGNLDVGDPRHWWKETLEALQLQPLVFRAEHIDQVGKLAPHHSDPFDRALIATAIAENLTMLTTDAGMKPYAGDRFRIVY